MLIRLGATYVTIVNLSFYHQGSYGIVKLAYNKEDDSHYVREKSCFFFLRLMFITLFLSPSPRARAQAMKILSKKKLKRKAGIFGE